MDSMKVYREMDVITAKPSRSRRSEVPYHLIDIVDPDVEFSVAEYLPLLERALGEVESRGRRAVIVGGTALYLKGFLDGFRTGPAADWSLRNKFFEEAKVVGPEGLHERLRQIDAVSAQKIHPKDLRRTVRALEVLETTGRPLSEGWQWGEKAPAGIKVFGLERRRAELYARIDRRVEAMVAEGLFEEAERLMARNPPLSRSASQAIGYKEGCEGLSTSRSRTEIVARIQQSTRQFAKRQLTWFRKLPLEWIQASEGHDSGEIARQILERG